MHSIIIFFKVDSTPIPLHYDFYLGRLHSDSTPSWFFKTWLHSDIPTPGTWKLCLIPQLDSTPLGNLPTFGAYKVDKGAYGVGIGAHEVCHDA